MCRAYRCFCAPCYNPHGRWCIPSIPCSQRSPMDAEELQHNKELLEIRKKRKRFLEKQAAAYGMSVDARIPMEIEELVQQIQALEHAITMAEAPRLPPPARATQRNFVDLNNHDIPKSSATVRRSPVRQAPDYSEPVTPILTRRQKPSFKYIRDRFWILLVAILFLALIYAWPVSSVPMVSSWNRGLFASDKPTSVSTGGDVPTQTQRETLSVGQAWEKTVDPWH
jgi:hypothetical protein